MLVERLKSVDAFVVFDLEDAGVSAGVVRSAPKVLVEGAGWLARSVTYQFASFGIRAGGASAAVNAPPEGRPDALAAFVSELGPWVSTRRFVPDAARGVTPTDLTPLRASDPRPAEYWDHVEALAAAGIVAGAEAALGGLEGRTMAIEGFDGTSARVATEVAARGGRIVAIGTAAGTALQESGFDAHELAGHWDSKGPDLIRDVEADPGPAGAVLGAVADVLVVGSRAGIIDHGVAAGCATRAVVPSGPIPVTAKGLAVLRRAGVCVLPDFVTTAGTTLGGLVPALEGAPSVAPPGRVAGSIRAVLDEVLDHEHGPLLGACARAEAFLGTWRETLPFGRPLA